MNRSIRISMILSMLVVASFGVGVMAQTGVNGDGWWTTIAVQNTDSSAGSVTASLTGYAKSGTTGVYGCGDRTLATYGSGTFFYPHWASQPSETNCVNDGGFPSDFEGAAVLSANGDIRAVSQLTNISDSSVGATGDSPYGRASGAYGGIVSPSTTIFYPLYKLDHADENGTFYIQNAGASNTDISAVFKPCSVCLGAGNVYTYTVSNVEPNKMVVIDASLATGPSGSLPSGDNSYGGVTITSSGEPLAGAMLEHHISESPALFVKANRLFNESDANSNYYASIIKYAWPDGAAATEKNRGKWSGVSIYNADTVQVTTVVTLTVTGRDSDVNHADVGTQYTQTHTIDPGNIGLIIFYDAVWNPAPPPTGAVPGDLYTAEFKADGNIAVMINEEGDFALAGSKDLATYAGTPETGIGKTISVPVYKENWKGLFHGVGIYNVSASTANVTVKLVVSEADSGIGVSTGDTVWMTTSIPANESATVLMTCGVGGFLGLSDVTDGSDSKNMADLCDAPTYPYTKGSVSAMIIESDQNVITLINEEIGWWETEDSVGDGYGVDASNYEGFPLP